MSGRIVARVAVVGIAMALAACSNEGGGNASADAENAGNAAAPAEAAMSVERLDPALDAVIAPNSPIEKLATGFIFSEGPVWYKGRLWFADLPNSRIVAMTPDGKAETLIEQSGGAETPSTSKFKGSNGMVVDKDGTLLATQHAGRRIVRIDDKLKITSFLDKFEGKRLNSPNDLVFAPDGSLWFTDPPYGLAKQNDDPAKEVPFNGVYRYKDGKLTAAIKDLTMPNGIGFSPDGKILYVNNSGPAMALWRYDVAADGTVSNGKALISYPGTADDVPDGLKVDAAGNVWASGPGGIRIISPAGKVLGQIKLPEVAANLAWADDGKTAYLTGSTSIYRLKLAGQGKMPLYVKP
jgi:gluconolactonase